jgi:hypothetical protein
LANPLDSCSRLKKWIVSNNFDTNGIAAVVTLLFFMGLQIAIAIYSDSMPLPRFRQQGERVLGDSFN